MRNLFTNFIYRIQKLYNLILLVLVRFDYKSKKNPSISKATLLRYNKQRNKGPKKTLCFAPFKHMYFKSDGTVTPCCRNDTDLYGTVTGSTLTELWHSKSIEALRNKIEDYDLCGGCNYCHTQLESSNFNAFEGRLYDSVLPSKAGDFPSEMTFEISNLCNLECIMCDGNYSSSIRKNREKLPELENKYGSEFTSVIREGIPYLKVARFLGGEPFLIPQYIDIIESIIARNPSCDLYIQTNGTILNNRVKKIIEHKRVHLSISIDSLQKERYEMIRKNSSFERLMGHMKYFAERSRKYNQVVNINFCVMTNNWQEVPEMLAFCNAHKFSLSLIPVEYPRYLSLRALNSNSLQQVLQHYQSPEHQKTMRVNKFNGAKFNDLIQYISFCTEQIKPLSDRIFLFNKLSIRDLELLTHEHLTRMGLPLPVCSLILKTLDSTIAGRNDSERHSLYATFLIDAESHPNETPVYHYKDSVEWLTLLKAYFSDLMFCADKKSYL